MSVQHPATRPPQRRGSQADTWLWIQSIGQPLRQTEGSVYVATKLQLRHVTSAIVMWFVAEQSYTTIRKHLPFPRNSTSSPIVAQLVKMLYFYWNPSFGSILESPLFYLTWTRWIQVACSHATGTCKFKISHWSPKCALRIPRDLWSVPRGHEKTFCNGYFAVYLVF